MTDTMNRLAIQFAQDGHLSFNQKCRGLFMQSFGHGALIKSNDLVKNGHCKRLNLDTYRLKVIRLEHLSWLNLLNLITWLGFIASLLELLPWGLQYADSKLYFRPPFKNQLAETLRKCYLALCYPFLTVLLHIIIHFILAMIRLVLAPGRLIIRPSIALALDNPDLFCLMLLITFVFTATLAWYLLAGNFTLVIGGIALTSTVSTQVAALAIVALVTWILLLKCYTLVTALIDIDSRGDVPMHEQMVEVYLDPKAYTDNICRAVHGLNPEHTAITKPEEQDFCHSLSLLTGTEALFYPPRKGEQVKHEYVHFEAQYFVKPSTETLKYKARDFLQAFIYPQDDYVRNLADILGLQLNHSDPTPLATRRGQVIEACLQKMQQINDIIILNKVVKLLLRDNLNNAEKAARIIMDNQPQVKLQAPSLSS